MKRSTILSVLAIAIFSLIVFAPSLAQLGPSIFSKKVIAVDSLRSQGPATFNDFIYGTSSLRGTSAFYTDVKKDTISAPGVTSGSFVFLTPLIAGGFDQVGMDTVKNQKLWAAPGTDEVLVYSSGAYTSGTLGYSYVIVK